jgi:quinol monooxygenase YgiN
MQIFIFDRFHAREGQEQGVAEALRDMLGPVRAESGCLTIGAFRSTRDPRLFFVHSRWINEDTFDRHASFPYAVKFLERIRPLIDHKLDVTRTRPVG